MQPHSAIGIFDSGFGGLTVFRAIRELLPHENIVYFGDTAHLPYGNKSAEVILRYVRESVAFLAAQGIKILVIACNTACSAALDKIREECPIPIIGIIEQGVKEIVRLSPDGKIVILATRATLTSRVYENKILEKMPHAVLRSIACPLFVSLVEEGYVDHPLSQITAHEYLSPLKTAPIDSVLLGCTHYPLLTTAIQNILPEGVIIVDPAAACAEETKAVLIEKGLLNTQEELPTDAFYVSDNPDHFHVVGQKFLSAPLRSVMRV